MSTITGEPVAAAPEPTPELGAPPAHSATIRPPAELTK